MPSYEFEINDEFDFPVSDGLVAAAYIHLRGDAKYDGDRGIWEIDRLEIATYPTGCIKGRDTLVWTRIDDDPAHKNIVDAAKHYLNNTVDVESEFNLPAFNPYQEYAVGFGR